MTSTTLLVDDLYLHCKRTELNVVAVRQDLAAAERIVDRRVSHGAA